MKKRSSKKISLSSQTKKKKEKKAKEQTRGRGCVYNVALKIVQTLAHTR